MFLHCRYLANFAECDRASLCAPAEQTSLDTRHTSVVAIVQVFNSVAKDVMLRLRETQQAGGGAPAASGKSIKVDQQGPKKSSSGCCS